MANEHLFVPRRSSDTLGGAANGGLGGLRSATAVADVVSAITSVTTDRVFVDSTQIGSPDRTGAWIVFLDTNLNEVREVVGYVSGSGTFTLDRALPITPVATDRYHLFVPNGLFGRFNAASCRSRLPRYRLAYAHNTGAGALDNIQAWVVPIIAGPIECRIAMGTVNFSQATNFDVADIANENATPALVQTEDFLKVGAGTPPQIFERPVNAGGAHAVPYSTRGASSQSTINATRERPIWVQLSFAEGAPIPRAGLAVYQVFIQTSGPTSSFLVVVAIDGVTEDVQTTIDRRLRVVGGARIGVRIRDSVDPFEEVPGAAIKIVLQSGPGSMAPVQAYHVQEGDEPVRRVYLSSGDPDDEGETVVFRSEVT